MSYRNMALYGTVLGAAALIAGPAASAPVDLSDWKVDGGGNWTLQSGASPNDSVKQTLNSRPTVFFNDMNSQGASLSGTFEVQTTSDDDFFGFALGYDENDIFGTNPTTDYILIDWKQGTQGGWDAGMAASRVTGSIDAGGTDTSADAWDHVGNVNLLERAATLGDIGWEDNTEYLFDIVFTESLIQVAVDGVEQFVLNGTFEDGSFGFYNFSQPDVLYAGITEDTVTDPDPDPDPIPDPGSDPTPVPAPGSLGLIALGLLGLRLSRRN